jgi:hypothetical protein
MTVFFPSTSSLRRTSDFGKSARLELCGLEIFRRHLFQCDFIPPVLWCGTASGEEVNKKLAILKKKIFEEAEIMASKIDDLMHQLQEVFECSDLLISTSLGS